MDFIYKPTPFEIKLIILYAVKNLEVATSYTLLDIVISQSANVNYFELGPYIDELMNTDNLIQYDADGGRFFSITDTGVETLGFFERKIPASIRDALNVKISEINLEAHRGNKLSVDYIPLNQNEYTVKFSIKEGGVVVLDFEVYAGPRERAQQMCTYLKNNTGDFYKAFMEILDNGIKQ